MTSAASLRSALATDGVCSVGRYLEPERTALLRSEAAARFEVAEPMVLTEYELGADGQDVRSPLRLRAARGDRLRETHESDRLVALASELAGRPMQPSYTTYLYYAEDDFIGLHLDLPACELTVLAGIDEDAPPLIVHPELRGLPAEELLVLARATGGLPAGGVALPVAPGALVALDGGVVPHQTPRHRPGGRFSTLASLCYVAAPAADARGDGSGAQ